MHFINFPPDGNGMSSLAYVASSAAAFGSKRPSSVMEFEMIEVNEVLTHSNSRTSEANFFSYSEKKNPFTIITITHHITCNINVVHAVMPRPASSQSAATAKMLAVSRQKMAAYGQLTVSRQKAKNGGPRGGPRPNDGHGQRVWVCNGD